MEVALTVQELCESGGGTHSSRAVCKSRWHSQFRSCVKVEVAVLGFLPLIVWTISVDVK